MKTDVLVSMLVSTLLMLRSWFVSSPNVDRELTDSREVADKNKKKVAKVVRGLTIVAFILYWLYLKYLIAGL